MSNEAKARALGHKLRRVHYLQDLARTADAGPEIDAEYTAQADAIYRQFARLGWDREDANRLVSELPSND